MFGRILARAMAKRKSRVALALVSIVVGVSIAAVLISVSGGVEDKISEDFRAYGANIIVVPKSEILAINLGGMNYGSVTEQKYINESHLAVMSELGQTDYEGETVNVTDRILGYAPYLYSIGMVEGTNAVIVGTDFEGVRLISPWWNINGSWATNDGEAMIGASAANKLNLSMGDRFEVSYTSEGNERTMEFMIMGLVSTGSDEEEQVFLTLDAVQNLTDRPNAVSMVQISAICSGCPVEVIANRIQEKVPNIEARSVKQVANAEMMILGKIESLLGAIAAAGLLASGLGVMSTMSASVLERKKEIGIMKAVGASKRKVLALFATEAVLVGIGGGLIGFFAGTQLASVIAMKVFGTPVSPSLSTIPISAAIAIGLSLLASALPTRRALNIEPAIVLRGD